MLDGAFLADELAQPLAHVVPVDQEHNARSEVGEEAVELGSSRSA